jgi:hypothetical protein
MGPEPHHRCYHRFFCRATSGQPVNKHLLTLEGVISTNQTDEMKAMNLRVVPFALRQRYASMQLPWLYKVADFIQIVV